jgi:RimJ/RimL family protein N-acetyltransferase
MSVAELIVNATQSNEIESAAETNGLPPPFVAMRSLAQIEAGKPASWCSPFLIVRTSDQAVMGACGFKDVPCDGRVEIGYAVSSNYRKQGVATAAVRLLFNLAYQHDSVTELLATIAPENQPSIRVVRTLGFERGGTTIDNEGEELVCWHHRRGSPLT